MRNLKRVTEYLTLCLISVLNEKHGENCRKVYKLYIINRIE